MRSIHGSFEILSRIVFSLEKYSRSYMYMQAVYLRDIRTSSNVMFYYRRTSDYRMHSYDML